MHLKKALDLFSFFQTELSLMFWFSMGFMVLVVFLDFIFFFTFHLLKIVVVFVVLFFSLVRRGHLSSPTGRNMLFFHKHMEILICTHFFFPWKTPWKHSISFGMAASGENPFLAFAYHYCKASIVLWKDGISHVPQKHSVLFKIALH